MTSDTALIFQLTQKVDGKTVTQNLPSPAAVRKAESEIAEFRRFQTHGRLDLEAVETALRSAMHQAGASALTQLLQSDLPDADHRTIPCPCGHSAHYKELRSKTVLTVLGSVELRRPYYACTHCSKGQYPADAELGVAGLESSPGVRRMGSRSG